MCPIPRTILHAVALALAAFAANRPIPACAAASPTPAQAAALAHAMEVAATNRTAAAELALGTLKTASEPASAVLFLAAGRLLCDADRPGEALAPYRALLAREPQHPEALHGLARAALAAGQPVVAETAFRQALLVADSEPAAETARRGLLHSLVQQARHAEADAVVAELLALRPDEASLWRLRGQLRLAQRQAEAAAAAYECAWRLGDRSDETRLTLAELHLAGERTSEARALLEGYVPGSEAVSNRVERLQRALPQG